jgi:hypothetical protein
MRCHSCAHLDLFTKLSPERLDDGLSVMVQLSFFWVRSGELWRPGVRGGQLDGFIEGVAVA